MKKQSRGGFVHKYNKPKPVKVTIPVAKEEVEPILAVKEVEETTPKTEETVNNKQEKETTEMNTETLNQVQDILADNGEATTAKTSKRKVKVEKKEKGIIERTEDSVTLITEDNKTLLID